MIYKSIPVFFNTDNNYAVPTYIALFSLLYNYRGQSEIHAYILVAEDFSDKNSNLINSLSDRFKFAKIAILKSKNNYALVSINQKGISTASLYRLLIPGIAESLHDEKIEICIYLDSDLVVEGDISELYRIDMNGYYIGGVGDWLQTHDSKDRISIPSIDKYINSGVLLINTREINKTKNLKEELENAGHRNDFLYNDQDAINVVLYKGIKLLPLKYNAMVRDIYQNSPGYFKQYGKENIAEARSKPFIVHFITDIKPWLYKTTTMAGKWWKYVKMQDKKTMDEYISPFLDAHRVPLYKTAKETIKTLLKHMGVFYVFKKKPI